MGLSSIADANRGPPEVGLSAPAIAVAKKALDQQKTDGDSAQELIESAAPPPKPGHKLSVMA